MHPTRRSNLSLPGAWIALGCLAGCGSAAPEPITPTPSSASVVDLGLVNTGDPIAFDVPTGTLGFQIVAQAAPSPDDAIGVQELRSPSGSIVAQFVDVAQPGSSLIGGFGEGIGALRVPLVDDNAAQPIEAGRWTVVFGGSHVTTDAKGPLSGQIHGAVRFQGTSDGAFHGGTLDLDLYIPDGLRIAASTITAATAADDPELQSRLDHAYELFDRLYGVGRGEVRYHALAAALAAITGPDAIDSAFEIVGSTADRPAGQIVLTDELSPEAMDDISGIDGCLPGAIGIGGTVCSAIIVSLRGSAWLDGSTIVHEMGHFVGLEHSTEFDGAGDSLSDTPECADMGKSALPSCPDHQNLMFPSVDESTDESMLTVSELQRALFRSFPLYQATR